jgi:hypothetical protein
MCATDPLRPGDFPEPVLDPRPFYQYVAVAAVSAGHT